MSGHLTLISFGFKYGTPPPCDWISDVRVLRNPFYNADLRNFTGRNKAVRDYVMEGPAWTEIFVELTRTILIAKMPYIVAVGCTGGRHRSVTVVEELAIWARDMKYDVSIRHRELDRWSDP